MAWTDGQDFNHVDLYDRTTEETVRHMLQDAAGRAMVAPTEDGETAGADYAPGAYLIRGGQLYRVTADITAGDAITPEENVEAAAVGDALAGLRADEDNLSSRVDELGVKVEETEEIRDEAIAAVNAAVEEAAVEMAQIAEEVIGTIPADYTELSEDVDDLKNALNYGLISATLPQNAFEQGGISGYDGGNSSTSAEKRIRTIDFIPEKISEIGPESGYHIAIYVYDANDSNAFLGTITDTGIRKQAGNDAWRTGNTDLRIYPNTYKYRIVVANTNDSDVTPATAYDKAIIYTGTDKSLSIENSPADAKAVGDALDTMEGRIESAEASVQALSGYELNGCVPIEYLESTGDGSVSMGMKLDDKSRVVCDYAATNEAVSDSGASYLFGGRSNTSSNGFLIGIATSSDNRCYYTAYNAGSMLTDVLADTFRHIIDFNQNNVYLDGALIKTFSSATFETPKDALMFACSGGGSTSYYGRYRIYSCKVYSNGVLVRDFIPAIRSVDNTKGMYDQVNNVFYAAEGMFTAGDALSLKTNADEIGTVKLSIAEVNGNIAEIENDISGLEDDISGLEDDISRIEAELADKPYIAEEADRVSEKVRAVQTGKSISFVAISDLHYSVDSETVQAALQDMRDGILRIAQQTHLDFYACFGDIIYRLSSDGNFDKGKTEIIAATKLINDAFGNNQQIRLAGNHDPNAEGLTGYFTPNELNAYIGIYSNMLTIPDIIPGTGNKGISNGGVGYCDFERQKVRMIALNTSLYFTTPTQHDTQYSFQERQALWLAQTLDMSSKSTDAQNWQIVIVAHIALDYETKKAVAKYTNILDAYQAGSTWTGDTYSYDFSGKNAAKIALYMNGHMHSYVWKNMRICDSDGAPVKTTDIANLYVPNALPDRDYPGTDGVTYAKTANSATSTAFQIITIDFENKIVYAHHYGAGIDVVMHYAPQSVTSETTLSTNLTSPTWASNDATVATVGNGVVTPVADGNTMIWAKSADDNCVEVWNVSVDV